MKHIPPIKSVMTPFPHHVESDRSIADARRMMQERQIRHLPVVRDGMLVGIISDSDLRLASRPSVSAVPETELKVADLLGETEAYVVELTEPLDVVVSHMARHRIDAALVVKQARLVGIFTTGDACRELGAMLRTLFPRGNGNDAA